MHSIRKLQFNSFFIHRLYCTGELYAFYFIHYIKLERWEGEGVVRWRDGADELEYSTSATQRLV